MEVASSRINIINIDDDDADDDVNVLYAIPSKGKGVCTSGAVISVEEYSETCRFGPSCNDNIPGMIPQIGPSSNNNNISSVIRQSGPSCSGTKKITIDLSEEYQDDEIEIQILGCQNSSISRGCSKGWSNSKSIDITDDNDDNFTCDICVDEKAMTEMFRIMGCNHTYCKQCMATYVATKIQENISIIPCPDTECNGQLEPHYCRSILPTEVFNRWGDVLCEKMILGSERFYCPFKDCSALLIDENLVIIESECPECRRLFCAKCKVPWHSGIVCEEYQKLHKDEREREDIQLMHLAKNQEWQRCPKCRIFVARVQGCAQMLCRCGCYFCYKCGAVSSNHVCRKCGVLNGL